MAKAPSAKEQEAMGRLLARAREGCAPWLDRLVVAAGYLRGWEGLSAKQVARLFPAGLGKSGGTVTAQAVGLWTSKMGCPRNGDGTYNLAEVIRWRIRLLEDEAGQGLDDGQSEARDLYWEEKARITQINRLELERRYLARDAVHDSLGRMAGVLRRVGEQMQRAFGVEAQEMLDDAVDDFGRELEAMVGGGGGSSEFEVRSSKLEGCGQGGQGGRSGRDGGHPQTEFGGGTRDGKKPRNAARRDGAGTPKQDKKPRKRGTPKRSEENGRTGVRRTMVRRSQGEG